MAYSDVELLARLIQCEAGGEGDNGMRAVASVIMNRVRTPIGEYSRTGRGSIRNIAYQKGQFDCVREGEGQNIYNMEPVTFTATNAGGDKNFEAAVPFIYQFDAQGGKVFVAYDDETKVYTVTANMPDAEYTFSHWEVDGKKAGMEPTYTFTAVDGANSTVKAVYTTEKVEVTWNATATAR